MPGTPDAMGGWAGRSIAMRLRAGPFSTMGLRTRCLPAASRWTYCASGARGRGNLFSAARRRADRSRGAPGRTGFRTGAAPGGRGLRPRSAPGRADHPRRHSRTGRIEDFPVTPGHPRGDEVLRTGRPYSRVGFPAESHPGIYPECPVALDIVEMIRNKHDFVVNNEMPVEIMQNEKSGKPETPAPEGIGNPDIKIIEIRRRGVIGVHGSVFVRVIVVDFLRIGISLGGRLGAVCLACGIGTDGQLKLIAYGVNPPQRLGPAQVRFSGNLRHRQRISAAHPGYPA